MMPMTMARMRMMSNRHLQFEGKWISGEGHDPKPKKETCKTGGAEQYQDHKQSPPGPVSDDAPIPKPVPARRPRREVLSTPRRPIIPGAICLAIQNLASL